MNAILGPLAALSPEETQIEIDRALCRRSLAEFVRRAWNVLEPPTQPLLWDWPLDAICAHLEAVTAGKLNRLLINVPPGLMKSLLTGVFWPAWEWGPLNQPYRRVIGAAHNMNLATRDAVKMRRLVTSDWYQARWGHQFTLVKEMETKFETEKTGFRAAFPATSITGERGDRLIFDDPHSVDGAKSDAERTNVTETFRESLQTRLNNPDTSAIVVIMQRLHQEDVSGVILADFPEFEHLMLPMEFEPARRCRTRIGFQDPRTREDELLFPTRFSADTVKQLKKGLGVYATAGQLQQRPEPRGGGILKRDSWSTWTPAEAEKINVAAGKFPPFDFTVASLDTAYTEKEENDFSAMTVWGVFRDEFDRPQVMLVYAWKDKLQFNELVDKVEGACKKWRVDELWIESKAAGISVAQEIRRRMAKMDYKWSTQLIDPGRLDKVARAYSVQGIFDEGLVWAPATRWADAVINECAVFPKGSHDDYVDTVTQALRKLRAMNFLLTDKEIDREIEEHKKHRSPVKPLYDA